MKTLFSLLILFIGFSAQADLQEILYGKNLCSNVTFIRGHNDACERWVYNNQNLSLHQIAVGVCSGHNIGPAARAVNCYIKAAGMINNAQIYSQTSACLQRFVNYNPRATCMNDVFRSYR